MRAITFAIATLMQLQAPVPQEISQLSGKVIREGTMTGIAGAYIEMCAISTQQQMGASAATLPSRATVGEIRIPNADRTLEVRNLDGVVLTSTTHECRDRRSAITDDLGHFVISGVRTGQYSLSAKREGYVASVASTANPELARMTVTLQANRREGTEILFSMVRSATISGRILDSSGKFMPDVVVRAVPRNGPSDLQFPSARSTNDRGEYRLFVLPPGEYFVVANPAFAARPALSGADSRQPISERDVFFPGTGAISRATPVKVDEGADITGIDFILSGR